MLFQTRLDRRITLQKPPTTRDSDYNETQVGWVTVFERIPAGKVDKASGRAGSEKEQLKLDNALRSEIYLEWEIRYLGINNIPKANWRLIDEYGDAHEIVSPPVEIGRRAGWLVKTKQVQ